jgi:uncharacterized protein
MLLAMSTKPVARHVRGEVLEALGESRAVALLGARQVGKSTLARELAASGAYPARLFDLDDDEVAAAARLDPRGFVAEISGPAIIDEVQRAPGLLLAIKQRLDTDQSRGQFLLTGSANLLTLPTVADALPGRVEYVNLWPFSQGELRGRRETFIERLFEGGGPPPVSGAPVGRGAVAGLIVTGGYPEPQGRGARGRARFFASYVSSLLSRDLGDVASVRDVGRIEQLLRVIAARSGALASFHGMASDLGIDAGTVRAHTEILESLFLVRRLRPWTANLGSRQVKTPKLYVVDSGLLASLLGAGERRFVEDGGVAGALLESFVAMELVRQSDWCEQPLSLFHYRDKQQREVDVVLERHSGEVVGVEVKAAATVDGRDLAGLRHLRDRLGERFKAGVVLYTGSEALPFGERLSVVPLSGLWA